MSKNAKKKYSFNNRGPQGSSLLIWLGVLLGFFVILAFLTDYTRNIVTIPYSSFYKRLQEGDIKKFEVSGQDVQGVLSDDSRFVTVVPQGANFEKVVEKNPDVVIDVASQSNSGMWYMIILLGIVAGAGAAWFFSRRMGRAEDGGAGGGGNIFTMGKSRAKMFLPSAIKENFNSVAGAHEAKEELKDVVEFLKNPEKYQRLGAKIARGVLLVGEPGNGKTLLAKAVAGEANCPFFSVSGSDFMEVFVGIGAARVRDLFKQARDRSPSIIFIDEIDAIGRHRGSGMGGGHDEREQTLNQLLTEMDGFETVGGSVIVIAATNRPDVLDKALLRPGRFDRQVNVPYPDLKSREQILGVHAKGFKIDPSVDMHKIARGTPGFSGADLANLINEAAVIATKNNQDTIQVHDFEQARDKVMLGAESKTMVQTPEELKSTAVHEAGHALIRLLLPAVSDPLHKVTIIPRGRALGVTHSIPEKDSYSRNKEQMIASIMAALGGRAAEELVNNEITTGAMSDFETATNIARSMVCYYGMSELGTAVYNPNKSFEYSERTAQHIDEQVEKILNTSYDKTMAMLRENRDKLDLLSHTLFEKETLYAAEIYELLGIEPRVDHRFENN